MFGIFKSHRVIESIICVNCSKVYVLFVLVKHTSTNMSMVLDLNEEF